MGGSSGVLRGVGVGEASGVGTGGRAVDFLTRLPDCARPTKAQSKIKPTKVAVTAGPVLKGNDFFILCRTHFSTVAVAWVYLLD
jgi:hypothetical protein